MNLQEKEKYLIDYNHESAYSIRIIYYDLEKGWDLFWYIRDHDDHLKIVEKFNNVPYIAYCLHSETYVYNNVKTNSYEIKRTAKSNLNYFLLQLNKFFILNEYELDAIKFNNLMEII